MPLVSVIMNVRNGASTLREALDSVMAQTFTDWELIVWDDRSTDDSAQIVARYSDPRIRYFLSPEETSLGKARDTAIRQARGEWLAFLDQDDLWMPRKLEMQMALAEPETLESSTGGPSGSIPAEWSATTTRRTSSSRYRKATSSRNCLPRAVSSP